MKRRLTLHFPREAVHQPITYRLAVDYDIAAKILRAQIARVLVERRAIGTDDLLVIAHVEEHVRMIIGCFCAGALELLGTDLDHRDTRVIVKVGNGVVSHMVLHV